MSQQLTLWEKLSTRHRIANSVVIAWLSLWQLSRSQFQTTSQNNLLNVSDRLPELLGQYVQQAVLPAHVYHYILDFLTSLPTPEQIAAFRPSNL